MTDTAVEDATGVAGTDDAAERATPRDRVNAARRAMGDWIGSHVVAIVVGAAAVVFGWPSDAVGPRGGLDPSWRLGLQLAHQQGIPFGNELAFTYGPLGFLQSPSALSRVQLVMYLGAMALMLAAFYAMTYRLLVRHGLSQMVGALVAFAAMLILPISGASICEFLFVAAIATVVDALVSRTMLPVLAWIGFGVLTATCLQMKFSTGLAMLPLLGLAVLLSKQRWPRTLAYAASFLVAFVALWAAGGQDFGQIPAWFSFSLQLSLGYGSGMAIETPSLAWEYPALLLVGLGFLAVAFAQRNALREQWKQSKLTAIGVAAIVAAAADFILKQGYIRHDKHSVLFWFALAYAVLVSVRWAAHKLPATVAYVAGVVTLAWCGSAVQGTGLVALADPLPGARTLTTSMSAIVSSQYQQELVSTARNEMLASYQVPDGARAAVGNEPTAADPYEISAVWATGMPWQPSTVLQRYTSLTVGLDQANAKSLQAATGPTRILQQGIPAIDGRYSLLESPAYVREMLCGYRVGFKDERWQVLERSTSRCGAPERMQQVTVGAGQEITLPTIDASREALLVSYELKTPIIERAIAAALKPVRNTNINIGGTSYRALDTTASVPGLLYVPPTSGWSDTTRIKTSPPESLTLSRPATITIYRMDVAAT
jgi:hypothetical protein